MNRKEEILRVEYGKLITNADDIYRKNPSIIEAAHTSMSIYAKEIAIGFANYLLMASCRVLEMKPLKECFDQYLKTLDDAV